MQLKTEERTYLTLVRLSGRVGAEDRHRLFQAIDDVLRGEPLAIVWDLSQLDDVADLALALLVGAFAYQRLRGDPVIAVGPSRELTERLRAVGLGYEIRAVSDEQEGCLAILEAMPKRYDEFFCKVIVQEGFVTPGDLKRALLQFEREGKVGDFGRLLLREGMIGATQLLEAVCRQKSLLGDILVESGKLSPEELEEALRTQGQTREKLGDLLLRRGLATNEEIYEALKRQFKRRQRFRKQGAGQEPSASGETREGAPEGTGPVRSARLGEILLEQKLLSQEDLERSLQLQRQTQGREKLGDILVRLGFVDDSDLYKALLTQYQRTRGDELTGEARAGLEALISKLGHHDLLLVRQAAEGLLTLGAPAFSVLIASLRNPSPLIRRAVCDLVGDAMCFEAIPGLLDRLEDAVPRVKFEACWALTRITGQGFGPADLTGWHRWWRGVDPSQLPLAAAGISSHREDMARFLARSLEEGHDMAPFDVEYRSGQEEWEGGHVRMQIRGDGLVHVLHVVRGATNSYMGELPRQETLEVFHGYAGAGVLFLDTTRTADDPTETRHQLSLRIGNRYFRRSLLYYRELFQHWNFRAYESRLRDILRRLTRGAIM